MEQALVEAGPEKTLPDWCEAGVEEFGDSSLTDFRKHIVGKLSGVAVAVSTVRPCAWKHARCACVFVYCRSCAETCFFRRRFVLVPASVYHNAEQPGQRIVEEHSGTHAGEG